MAADRSSALSPLPLVVLLPPSGRHPSPVLRRTHSHLIDAQTASLTTSQEAARAERIAAGLEQPPRAGRGGGRGGRGARGGRGGRGGGRGAISEPPAKRAKVASGSGSSSDSDSDSDSDSSDGDSDSEDDDGPPVAVSAKLEVPPMFEGAAPASGEGRVTKPTPAGKPTIHPSRLRPEGEVEGDGPGDGVVQDESEARKRFQVVCRHWRAGECGLGAECPYLHSVRAFLLSALLPRADSHISLTYRSRPPPPPHLHPVSPQSASDRLPLPLLTTPSRAPPTRGPSWRNEIGDMSFRTSCRWSTSSVAMTG